MATQQVIKVQESFVSNNGNSLIEMAVAGNGIVMMPDWAVYDEIRSGKLVPILPDTPIASDNQEIYVAILTPPSAYRPINVQAVMDFLWRSGKRGRLGRFSFLTGWKILEKRNTNWLN